MNKFLLAISMVSAMTFAAVDAADAQQRRYGNQYVNRGQINNNYYRGGNRYVQNNFYGRRGGGWNNNNAAWAAGLGGLAIGAILGGALAAPAYGVPVAPVPGPNCVQVQVSQRLVPSPAGGYVQAPVFALQCY